MNIIRIGDQFLHYLSQAHILVSIVFVEGFYHTKEGVFAKVREVYVGSRAESTSNMSVRLIGENLRDGWMKRVSEDAKFRSVCA